MSLNSPAVSVVMSAYNAEKYIKESIDSVLNQTYGDFEIIIVNAGSTDRTQTILNSYHDPRIFVVNVQNMGRSEARNRAIEISKGEYIAIMDADDISLPERLERQVKFLDSHKDIALVGSSFFSINESGKIVAINEFLTESDDIKEGLPKGNRFGHSTVMARKSCLESIGGYRVELEGAEDYDLFLRLSKAFKLTNLKEPLCKWRLHPSSFSMSKKSELDRWTKLVQELAEERRQSGKDRLQNLKEGENQKSLNDLLPKAKAISRKDDAKNYYHWGIILFRGKDYQGASKLVLKSFISNPLGPWVLIIEDFVLLFCPEPVVNVLRFLRQALVNCRLVKSW
jgi:glycosyltransferase involved in cell wall biosynthesis